jgi:hypothetical protein
LLIFTAFSTIGKTGGRKEEIVVVLMKQCLKKDVHRNIFGTIRYLFSYFLFHKLKT